MGQRRTFLLYPFLLFFPVFLVEIGIQGKKKEKEKRNKKKKKEEGGKTSVIFGVSF